MRILPIFYLLLWTSLSQSYISSDSDSWPLPDAWTSNFQGTILHGPFPKNYYETECEGLGTNAYAISKAGNGICMHAHACKHEFCRDQYQRDLPAYIVEAKTTEDIRKAINFAKTHKIKVTVKTTGHSYHGASTSRDSLLIWMQNYPKNGTITENYKSCDDVTHHAVISINGGETWNDVIEAVGPNYHVVTGGGRTVSAAGGWLMGSGLSFSSPSFGLGVDNVLEFQVALADGSLTTANTCANTDLFWALRGGGGGTWGVVTNVIYKLHPVVPITTTNWMISGWEYASPTSVNNTLSSWLRFWIKNSPDLDNRFGGYWNAGGVHLVFAGTRDEANVAFLNEFQEWYWKSLVPNAGFVPFVFGAVSPFDSTYESSSWYEYRGGEIAYNNPELTDKTGDSYADAQFISARLMPRLTVKDNPSVVYDLLLDLALRNQLGAVNYILGGSIRNVTDDATAVHPALRNALWNVFTGHPDADTKVRMFLPNNVTGACFNHHSPTEPDWRNALWGNQYEKLANLKKTFDPDSVFDCWHCVGYQGDEPTNDIPSAGFSPLYAFSVFLFLLALSLLPVPL
jgi:hypothetical protein